MNEEVKVSQLPEATTVENEDLLMIIQNGINKKVTANKIQGTAQEIIYNNSGAHNSIYRGKDITDLFYDGILSEQIAAGTFDDIFVGDYIIGQVSGRKYLVADINYYINCGNDNVICTTNHLVMIPEKIMGKEKMNNSRTTNGGYIGSTMYTTTLNTYKTIIANDFGNNHILSHMQEFSNAVSNGYESGGSIVESNVNLMSEIAVYGANCFKSIKHGTNTPYIQGYDKSQYALFRLRHDLILPLDDQGDRATMVFRDVANENAFCGLSYWGRSFYLNADGTNGVRPYFLAY